ncbi:hypothetical protein EMIT036CA2_10102 [Chryseobacterium sp. IT-36CA2]
MCIGSKKLLYGYTILSYTSTNPSWATLCLWASTKYLWITPINSTLYSFHCFS